MSIEHLMYMLASSNSSTACPVCLTERSDENTHLIRSKIAELAKTSWFDNLYEGNQELAFKHLASGEYGWACDSCLKSGRALNADFNKQTFTHSPPYFSYADVIINCKTCSNDFIFTKEEQLYWYETLNFGVQSRAVNCISCRELKRERKERHDKAEAEINELKSSLNLQNAEQLEKLISLYQQIESYKKAEFYSNILKKL